ncbi:MAG: hypothetical protein A2603_04535 [Bdellovibrionales bacterium RIFOXYD1_FULL_55_31]|nr:MAG: hypothetical protein A2603_04535 [Bdellovibrionales bacterium RIFOXYD1_FULL_55_31]
MFTRIFTREWGIRVLVIVLATLWMALLAASWADAADAPGSGSGDEYSFSWLDPEKKIYVLQNRRYGKAHRLLLSAMAGTGFSNPYRTSYILEPRVAFYVSESIGFEAFHTLTSNRTNATFDALQQSQPSIWPVVREIKSQSGILAHWVPWYAKINVFNKILYFDWYFSGGIGTLQTALETRNVTNGPSTFTDQSFTALYLGTGHQYHVTRDFSVRLDFTSAFYQAPVMGLSGSKSLYSNLNFGIGVGLRL